MVWCGAGRTQPSSQTWKRDGTKFMAANTQRDTSLHTKVMDVWWQLTKLVRWGRRSNVYFRERYPTCSITLHGIHNTHERSKHVSSLPTPIMTDLRPPHVEYYTYGCGRLFLSIDFQRERERERWWWWNGANLIVCGCRLLDRWRFTKRYGTIFLATPRCSHTHIPFFACRQK